MVQRDITKQPPIGYWLKHPDEVITKHVNQVLCDNGFTRFRWQVLNMLYEAGTTTKNDIFTTMKTFVDAHQRDEILDGFDQEGWLLKSSDGEQSGTSHSFAINDSRRSRATVKPCSPK